MTSTVTGIETKLQIETKTCLRWGNWVGVRLLPTLQRRSWRATPHR